MGEVEVTIPSPLVGIIIVLAALGLWLWLSWLFVKHVAWPWIDGKFDRWEAKQKAMIDQKYDHTGHSGSEQ